MRNNLKYFTFLFIFFVVVAFGSIIVLNGSGSVFDRSVSTIGASQAVLQDNVVGTEPKTDEVMADAIENQDALNDTSDVEAALEDVNAAKEATVEETLAAVEETVEETEDEEQKEVEAFVSDLDESTSSASEETSVTSSAEVRYYRYTIKTGGAPLRLRDAADLNANITAKINTGSHGHILKPGNVWCKVYTASGKIGYLATEYLLVEEVTKEDFPADIQDQVEAPDETLTSAFAGNG